MIGLRIAIVAAAALLATAADAAEIKALVSTALKAPFEEIVAQFEKASGHKITASYGPTGALTKRIAGGEAADLIILGTPPVERDDAGLASLVKQGKIANDSRTAVARGLYGAGVAKGAPKPDISSEASLKAALLSAKSVAVTDPAGGGGSGVFFAKLFDKMGLTETLKPKLKYAAGGPNGYAGTIAAKGEAEFAMQPIAELMAVPGIEIVGPLPGAFQNATIYVASVSATAKEPVATKALIKALTEPGAATIYKSKGLEPG